MFIGEKGIKLMLNKRILLLLSLLFLSYFAEPALVFGAITGPEVTPPPVSSSRGEEISKILKVLENKMGDRQITHKTLDKLDRLSDEQIGLIATLSERIADNSRTVAAEVAFLLITALLVWS